MSDTRVFDYRTGERLPGHATRRLQRASAKAPAGAVGAFYDRGWWTPVRESEIDYYRRTLGIEVMIVYTEGAS